jgi:predicted nucleic acid-binding protein
VAYLVDTNVLVYRFDARYPDKQARATKLLRAGLDSGEARLAHQALVELVAATTRPLSKAPPLLTPEEARREVEDLLAMYTVLYPVEALLRLAIRGAATYQLSWFDAHMWAYAEHYSLSVLYSEDFQHDRVYGTVRIVNPFVD